MDFLELIDPAQFNFFHLPWGVFWTLSVIGVVCLLFAYASHASDKMPNEKDGCMPFFLIIGVLCACPLVFMIFGYILAGQFIVLFGSLAFLLVYSPVRDLIKYLIKRFRSDKEEKNKDSKNI